MPLRLILDEPAAEWRCRQGLAFRGSRRSDVGMGGYAVANNTAADTLLGTTGAGPCVAIVVHKGQGHGALGHYAATPNLEDIVAGVRTMIEQLGGGPVEAVVFAGGCTMDDRAREFIIKQVQPYCISPDNVRWPDDEQYSAVYYLPLTEEVCLLEDFSASNLYDAEGLREGITEHDYPPIRSTT